MKCHWVVEGEEKFWIPGCIQAAVHPMEDGCCPCRDYDRKRKKEADRMDPEKAAIRENKYLLKENARLNRIIEKLTNRKV